MHIINNFIFIKIYGFIIYKKTSLKTGDVYE